MSEVKTKSANNVSNEENNPIQKSPRGRKPKSSKVVPVKVKETSPVPEIRRITRSATKGVPATPPPPAKKERKTIPSTTTPSGKGRGRKSKKAIIEANSKLHEKEEEVIVPCSNSTNSVTRECDVSIEKEAKNEFSSPSKDEDSETKSPKSDDVPMETNSHEEKEELLANNNAEESSSKEPETIENGAKEENVTDSIVKDVEESKDEKKAEPVKSNNIKSDEKEESKATEPSESSTEEKSTDKATSTAVEEKPAE